MKHADIHAAILRVFRQHREAPDAPFVEEKFLDFLMADNRPLNKSRDSFRALWRLNGFYDALQLECAVCFEEGIAEKNWSVDSLTRHIAEKKKNPAAQKALVTKRTKKAERNLHFEPVKLTIFAIGPATLILYALFYKASGGSSLALIFPALGLSAVGFCYNITLREMRLYRELGRLLEKGE